MQKGITCPIFMQIIFPSYELKWVRPKIEDKQQKYVIKGIEQEWNGVSTKVN